jgi:hypothetical protein
MRAVNFAEREGVFEMPFRPFTVIHHLLLTASDSAAYPQSRFSSGCRPLPSFSDFLGAMALEMELGQGTPAGH